MELQRYSYDYFIDGAVFIDTEHDHDMDMDTVCDLLNQQDKEIKQAKENLSKFGNIISEQDLKIKELKEDCVIYKSSINELYKAQKQLALDEFEKLKDFFLEPYKDEEMDTEWLINKDTDSIANYVLNKIKELKGEN